MKADGTPSPQTTSSKNVITETSCRAYDESVCPSGRRSGGKRRISYSPGDEERLGKEDEEVEWIVECRDEDLIHAMEMGEE